MKTILTKLLAMLLATVMISGVMPLNAAVTVTDAQYSANGIMIGGTITQKGVMSIDTTTGKAAYKDGQVGIFVCDSLGRQVSGLDENNNPYSYAYDSFGNLASQTSYVDGKPVTTQFTFVLGANGKTLGRMGFSFNSATPMSESDFIKGIQAMMNAINDPNVKPQGIDSTTGGFNLLKDTGVKAWGTLQGISCTGKVLMAVFGSPEKFAKIMQFGTENADQYKKAKDIAQKAVDEAAQTAANAKAADNAQAAADEKAKSTWKEDTATASASGSATVEQEFSWTKIVQSAVDFAKEVWAAITDPNASISITLGSNGSVTGVNVAIPQGKSFAFTPKKEQVTGKVSSTKTANASASAKGTDPLVTGTYAGTEVIDGQTYVKINASAVNLFQDADFASGFDSTEPGEVIYIPVDGSGIEELIASVSMGEEITVAGFAQAETVTDSKGEERLVMTYNAEGGYAKGENSQQSFIANAQGTSGGQSFYNKMVNSLTTAWASQEGQKVANDYRAAWIFLAGLGA